MQWLKAEWVFWHCSAEQRLQEEQKFVRSSFKALLFAALNGNLIKVHLCPLNDMLKWIQMCQKCSNKVFILSLHTIINFIGQSLAPLFTAGLVCLIINCHWWIPRSGIWWLIWVIMQVNGDSFERLIVARGQLGCLMFVGGCRWSELKHVTQS